MKKLKIRIPNILIVLETVVAMMAIFCTSDTFSSNYTGMAMAVADLSQITEETAADIKDIITTTNDVADAAFSATTTAKITTVTTTTTTTVTTTITTVSTTEEPTEVPTEETSIEEEIIYNSVEETVESTETDVQSEYPHIIDNSDYQYDSGYSCYTDGSYWYFEPSGFVLDNQSYYALVNCVAHEAGSYYIELYDKALVCSVIFNRLNAWGYNSIYDVIAAPNQFTGSSNYINLGTYSSEVNDGCIEAVNYYCSHPESFNQGYLYFTGDGWQNHFR